MNYLAHIFLSGDNRALQVGNFIGDFVKGRRYEDFPQDIKRGILLHRRIDEFTDAHPIFRETVDVLRPEFGRYSGIMADMYFDYFLAVNFEYYSKGRSLNCFAYNFYFAALWYYRWLPQRVRGFIFHFIGTNRLKQYETYGGLWASLKIMSIHKTKAIDPEKGIVFLRKNEEQLSEVFHHFMPEVIDFANKQRHPNIKVKTLFLR